MLAREWCECLGTNGTKAVVPILGSYVLWLAPSTPQAPNKCILNYGRQIVSPRIPLLGGCSRPAPDTPIPLYSGNQVPFCIV